MKRLTFFLSEINFDLTNLKDSEVIEEKYFSAGKFRKIRKKLIYEVSIARIEEICDLIFKKNINLHYLKKKVSKFMFQLKIKLFLKTLKIVLKIF